MIYTVTLNPTLDKTLSVPQFRAGEVHRATLIRQDLGGKGINVSRALRELGIASEIVAVFAGATGRVMHDGLETNGYRCHTVWVDGETRQNLTLRDEANNTYTKINEPGPALTTEHADRLADMVSELAQPDDCWVFSGSLPPGAVPDLYARLINLVQVRGGRAFLDTSGPALAAGLLARPFAAKPNSEEMAELLDLPLRNDDEHIAAVRALHARGVALVCLSRGADGLALATDDSIILARPPRVEAHSPIGAGDATLAGLVWATIDGCDAAETAKRAVACGTAAAMQEGTGLGDRSLIESIIPQVTLH